jgi:hypothetical protein
MASLEPPGPAPVDDGWEPEPQRPGTWSRVREGPIEYFRAVPARFFAWLGGLVFAVGWLLGGYVAFSPGGATGGFGDFPTSYRIGVLLNIGVQATIAAGLLWGVAAFLWVRVLPAGPDDADVAESPRLHSP